MTALDHSLKRSEKILASKGASKHGRRSPLYGVLFPRRFTKKATRSQHGIRKGVADSLAANGATEYELMAMFGWSESKTAAVYTEKYDRRGSATSAAKLRSDAGTGPRPENRGPVSKPSACETRENWEVWQPVGESNPSFQVENLAS